MIYHAGVAVVGLAPDEQLYDGVADVLSTLLAYDEAPVRAGLGSTGRTSMESAEPLRASSIQVQLGHKGHKDTVVYTFM